MNIGEFKKLVGQWLDRTDLDAFIPRFVEMGCQRVYRSARTPVNEKILTGTTTNSRIEIPSDFIAVRWLAEDDRKLTAAPGHEVNGSVSGQPIKYGRLGDFINLYPKGNIDFTLSYFTIEDFQQDTDSPNLLQVALDCFLYAALVEATPFLQDDARLPVWEAKFQQAMATLKESSDDADLGDVTAIRSTV